MKVSKKHTKIKVRQYETTSTKECKNVDLPCKLQMLNKQIRIYRKH